MLPRQRAAWLPGGSQSPHGELRADAAVPTTGTLNVNSNDPLPSIAVSLSGTGVEQNKMRLSVNPTALAFGNVTVNTLEHTAPREQPGNLTCNVTLNRSGTSPTRCRAKRQLQRDRGSATSRL